jgi:excisionase family DNA binding protein
MADEEYIPIKEVCKMTGVKPQTVRLWMKNGDIKFYIVGKKKVFKKSEVIIPTTKQNGC